MKTVHIVTAFSRLHLKDTLIKHYVPMNIIWHPVLFEEEATEVSWQESWIKPLVVPSHGKVHGIADVGYRKKNAFIQNYPIVDDDYYCIMDDDDGIEPGAFDKIRAMEDDVIIISLKRGYHVPKDAVLERQYGTTVLIAIPENVTVGRIGQSQYIVKGWVFRQMRFQEEHCADGMVAEWLKENFRIRYEPTIFGWFNYFEPGRWDDPTPPKVAFGVLVNDIARVDMCLRQSAIDSEITCNTIKLPVSATTGLNKLLGIMEADGVEIGFLAHQDMYFRHGWLQQVLDQLSVLPDSWVVAGVIGKDREGEVAGKFHDMRIPLHFNTEHRFPVPAACFDECVIIVNMKKGFRFDETLGGFDLYGTLAVLQAEEMGGTAWIIDAFCEHYCTRPFTWIPDKTFENNFRWLHQRFPSAPRIDTTVLGVRKEDALPRYDLTEEQERAYRQPKFPSYRDDYTIFMEEGGDVTGSKEVGVSAQV